MPAAIAAPKAVASVTFGIFTFTPVTSLSICGHKNPLLAPPAKTMVFVFIPLNSSIFLRLISLTIAAFSCRLLNIEALLQILGSIFKFKKLGLA